MMTRVRHCLALTGLAAMGAAAVALDGPVNAAPVSQPPPPLPVITPTPSNWSPKFPFPFEQTRKNVTDADITAEREMCQWFNAEFHDLRVQIDQIGFDLLAANNDWNAPGIQPEADAVVANIDQSENFLAPRAQALTQSQDAVGDVYFPIYQGESFYRLWQYLSNVSVGLKARNTAWIYGPVVQREKHWGSKIERSHVCD
ncbi:hypothetical protein A5695_25080 [Mycobacterium sp. E1747]|nr:hypothetical protein A5695_25080 [Mycobacterium sp. E1747]